jgi:hypothetical protein
MELIEEIARTWTAETGLPAPYEKTVSRWLAENESSQIFGAIQKTARKVRSVAGREREFSIGQATMYCSNILKTGQEARSLAAAQIP